MTDEYSLFDAALERGRQEIVAARDRDEALDRVDRGADGEWKQQAFVALCQYLRTHETMFVDDFWRDTALATPRESRALGAVFRRALRAGLMRKSGAFRKSVRSHMTEKPVWRSLIYERASHA